MPTAQAIDPAMALTPRPDQQSQPMPAAPLRYIVQRVDAQSSRFDLRLELGGVLKSWEVGEPPSYFPGDHRVAARANDLPLSEGLLQGVYDDADLGRVQVSLWDWGYWASQADPHLGFTEGRLDFTLDGARLHGQWHLEKTSVDENTEQWSLIKKDDEHAMPSQDAAALIREQLDERVATGEGGQQGGGPHIFMWMPQHLLAPALVPEAPHPRFNADGEMITAENREREDGEDDNFNPFFSPQFLRLMPFMGPPLPVPAEMKGETGQTQDEQAQNKKQIVNKADGLAKLGGAVVTAGVLKQIAEHHHKGSMPEVPFLMAPVIKEGHVYIYNSAGEDVTNMYAITATELENELINNGVIQPQDTPHRPGVVMATSRITTDSHTTSNPDTPSGVAALGGGRTTSDAMTGSGGVISSAAMAGGAVALSAADGRPALEERIAASATIAGVRERGAGSWVGDGGIITSNPSTTTSILEDVAASARAVAAGSRITSASRIDTKGETVGEGARITTNSASGQNAGADADNENAPAGMPLAAAITTNSRITTAGGRTTAPPSERPLTDEDVILPFVIAEGIDGGIITTDSVIDAGIDGPEIAGDFAASAQGFDPDLPGPGPVAFAAGMEPAVGSPAAGEPDGGPAMDSHLEADTGQLAFDTPEMMPSFADDEGLDAGEGEGGDTDGGETDGDIDTGTQSGGAEPGALGEDDTVNPEFNSAAEGVAAPAAAENAKDVEDGLDVFSPETVFYYQGIAPHILAIAPTLSAGDLSRPGELHMPADRMVFTLQPGEGVSPKALAAGAVQLRDTLAAKGIASLPMSDGQGSVKIVVPEGGLSPEARHALAAEFATMARDAAPTTFGLEGATRNRIFIDIAGNEQLEMTVPFTVRGKPHAPVDMILDWNDLDKIHDPQAFELAQANPYVQGHIQTLSQTYTAARRSNHARLAEMGHVMVPGLTPEL